ncbi:response regulator transcription factor [Sphingobium sp. AN558]|uniref:response regulator transcription factor n=1 Tax=Sphingobium sp. AN558 TaxID=3133442 RepID=UPI0030C4F196
MALNILIVEGDDAFAAQLADQMRGFGHSAKVVSDGRLALDILATAPFDAIVLSRVLPTVDGLVILRRLRQGNMLLPVIMIGALGKSHHKIEGLTAGADDYMVRPIDAAELDARFHALLRGRQWNAGGSAETLRVGDLVISPMRHAVWRDGRALDLQKIEFRLLTILARHAGQAVSRATLLERVWAYDATTPTNLVEVHIRRLRTKLRAFGGDDPISTIRGVGYMLRN